VSLPVSQSQLVPAIRLFAWADATREQISDTRPAVEKEAIEKDLTVVRSRIDAIEFTRLSAEGCSMTAEQAITLALADVP
jgi:hypothetical protein